MPDITLHIDPKPGPGGPYDSPEEAAEAVRAKYLDKPFNVSTMMRMRAELEPYGLTCYIESSAQQSYRICRAG